MNISHIGGFHFSDVYNGSIEVSEFAKTALGNLKSKTVVSVDPGLTIGLAVATPIQIRFCQTKSLNEAVEFIDHHEPHVVVIEDFVGRGMLNSNMKTTIERIGAFIHHYEDDVKVFRQQPQLRKSFHSDATLIVNNESMPHATDAIAHLLANLYYLSDT